LYDFYRLHPIKLILSRLSSPLGDLLLVTDELEQLRALNCSGAENVLRRSLREHYPTDELRSGNAPSSISSSIGNYFDGDPQALSSIARVLPGDDFQRKVWTALGDIPYGQTMSYGELARSIGLSDPRMAVAVGAANASNPIAIVIPCHRVIAKNGDLRGYAWGIARKRWLITHEGALSATQALARVTARLPGL
jgi:methylated-DNA-[protein]-cysteine S-methyltransferase